MIAKRATYSSDWIIPSGDTDAVQPRLTLLRDFYRRMELASGGDPHPTETPQASRNADPTTLRKMDTLDAQNQTSKFELIQFPEYKPLKYTPSELMWAMQEWDGHVVHIGDSHFVGLITPVGATDENSERLEYPLNLLKDVDLKNIVLGSLFRVSAGYTRKSTGRLSQDFSLYFRPKTIRSATRRSKMGAKLKFLLADAVEAPPSELFERD